MAWKDVKEAIYTLADGMAPAGYNYDWEVGRRSDRNYKKPTFILEYPVGVPFETDVSKSGGISSQQQRLRRRCLFVGRVISDMKELRDNSVIDANNDALDKALADIRKRFNGTIGTTLCENAVKKVQYVNATKRALSSKGVYYPYELVVAYDIDYVIPII